MKLTIKSHAEAGKLVRDNQDKLDVIFITSPVHPFNSEGGKEVLAHSKSLLVLMFDDIDFPRGNFKEPLLKHIEEAIEFSKEKSDILVSCHAGCSRSSAMAYVLKCIDTDPKEALKILDPYYHNPNNMVIRLGAKFLDKMEMIDLIDRWKDDMIDQRTLYMLN
jgi:predicted protein tyrosine phosphatase